ncbi:hypothetical protein Mapa_012912 [Marchantia paleacea]|nr:hypothetical protein Mapa_012912 [Marchantia paleacea]
MAMRPQIILLGDSITEQSFGPFGWGAALADQYKGKYDVVARGFTGYNTRWTLFLLGKIFPIRTPNPPSVVTVFLGANDAAIPGGANGWLHVPLPEYRDNLHQIIAHLKAQSDSTLIILITPPPVSEKGLLACSPHLLDDTSGQPTHVNQFTGMYAQECVSVAREADVQCLNLWSIFQETPRWEALLSDGIHLSVEGNQVVFEELVKLLDESDIVPSTLKIDTLKLDEVPYDSPEEMEDGYDSPDSSFQTWSAPKVKELLVGHVLVARRWVPSSAGTYS